MINTHRDMCQVKMNPYNLGGMTRESRKKIKVDVCVVDTLEQNKQKRKGRRWKGGLEIDASRDDCSDELGKRMVKVAGNLKVRNK